MPPLLPRYSRWLEKVEDERRIARAILEADAEFPDGNGSMPLRRSADGHNPARLRGLPAIGRSVSGEIRGTNPLGALLAKESRRR